MIFFNNITFSVTFRCQIMKYMSYNYDSIARRRVLGGLELEIYG